MRFLKNLTSITTLATVLLCSYTALADGDPLESSGTTSGGINSPLVASDLNPDEQIASSEEAVATITADGDFLLPTYLLPGETATVTRKTTVEKTYDQIIPSTSSVSSSTDLEQGISETKNTTSKTLAATEPISDFSDLDALLQETAPTKTVQTKKERILIPLAPVAEVKAPEVEKSAPKKAVIQSVYADQLVNDLTNGTETAFKMPHEMRITFYPKAKSFSGQTLKWIKAFALTALQDPRLVVEVRASCAEAELQTDRLKLVQAALKEAGLSSHQVVINFTDRPVDTMLLLATPRQEKDAIVDAPRTKKMPRNKARVTKW